MNPEHNDFADGMAAAQDTWLDGRDDLADARARLLSGPPPRARLSQGLVLVPLAAAALAAFLVFPRAEAPLSASLAGAPLAVGDWVAASDAPAALTFSDGTAVTLEPGAQARLISVTAHGALLNLERGRAALSVVPADGAEWALEAGPFTVRVTGTVFAADWRPEAEVFAVEMTEGRVFVTGPTLGDGVPVSDVSALHVWLAEARFELANQPAPAREPAAVAIEAIEADAMEEPVAEVAPPPIRRVPTAPEPEAPAAPTWQELVAAERHAEAVARADALGLKAEMAAAAAGDLYGLGDAGRFAGRGDVANMAYGSVRSRFPGTDYAAAAAFQLGVLREGSRPQEAAENYQAYLAERPNGPLAMDALARLMHVLVTLDDRAAAREAAKTYLKRYPEGLHAAQARQIRRR